MDFLYVGDPLCSWCWGFAPSHRKLRLERHDAFRFHMIVGGLRTGANAQPLSESLRAYLAQAWSEVEARSGQPFDRDQLRTATFVYDTEPACRAVVAARALAPERVFDYNESLAEAFYRRGMDPTSPETFVAVARQQGYDEARFRESLDSESVAAETRADFELARSMGVMGFPTALVRENGRLRLVAGGFVPPDDLLKRVERWTS